MSTNSFKILADFQEQLDEFYGENQKDEDSKQISVIQPKELSLTEFETKEQFCPVCNTITEFEIFTLRHKKEIICTKCKTRGEQHV